MHPKSPRLLSATTAVTAVTVGALAFGLSLLGASSAVAAPTATTVTVAATPTALVGSPVDVSVGLLGTTDVYSYAITIAYDATLLDYVDQSASSGPSGGFDSINEGSGTVTILHSRLGTSPSLAGDLPASLQFTALASGDATLTTSVSLVDAEGTTTVLANAATAPVSVTALPIETTPPTAPPAPEVGSDPTPTPTSSPASSSSSNDDGSLATTGFGVAGLFIAAIAAVGVGFTVVRRRAASAR